MSKNRPKMPPDPTRLPELQPGPAHPYRCCRPAELAEQLGLSPARWQELITAGLPVAAADVTVDAFAVCNWLGWEAPQASPVLQRRWQRFRRFFESFIVGDRAPRRLCWRRLHQAFVPVPIQEASWWLPEALRLPQQWVLAEEALGGAGASSRQLAGGSLHQWTRAPDELALRGAVRLELRPAAVRAPDDPLRRDLGERLIAFAGDFRYAYRHHVPADTPRSTGGSCLDAALAFAATLPYDWALCAGCIAATGIANPHYWLEVDDGCGPACPCDPSLIAIARMLEVDWRHWAVEHVGWHDGRRIQLAVGPWSTDWRAALPPPWTGAGFCSPVPGELLVRTGTGLYDAWACQDWVCGSTTVECAVA